MPKYRRIPLVFEAEKVRYDNIAHVAEWCNGKHAGTRLPPHEQIIYVNTNHGEVMAVVGDWIIHNPKTGEFYPCDDKTFQASYEEIPPAPPKETEAEKLIRLHKGYSG